MCQILLSIHPQFVAKILAGEKRFEFRRVKTRLIPDKIIIYSTSPVCKIVGEAEVEEVIVDAPNRVWHKTKKFSGIDKAYYSKYYHNREIAIAYKLINVIEYNKPKELKDIGIKSAPQSFAYVNDFEYA